MKYLKTFENHNDMVSLYGLPVNRAKEMISDYLYHGYNDDKDGEIKACNSVLLDISEIIRNSVDHNEPSKEEYYKEVEKEVIKIKNSL
jgi:hypothetical protein